MLGIFNIKYKIISNIFKRTIIDEWGEILQ